MKKPLLEDEEKGTGCRRRWRPGKEWEEKYEKIAYSGPNDYDSKFPPLFFFPSRGKQFTFYSLCLLVIAFCTVCTDQLHDMGLTRIELLKYLSLPVVSVLFTFGHIWLALWMTFNPVNWFGIPGCQVPDTPWGLGWQGIVPSKSRIMGKKFINQITENLFSLQEALSRIDADELLEELRGHLYHELLEVTDDLGKSEAPDLWRLLPKVVKDELAIKLEEDLPLIFGDLLERIKADIDKYFDMEEYVVKAIVKDKPLFNHAFITQGYPELCFIRDCGGYMGLFLGLVQMVQQFMYPAGWLLPVFGVIGGLFTNWLALKITFSPINPIPLFGGRVILHGCFLRRQQEFAPGYAKTVSGLVMPSLRLIPAIVVNSQSEALCELLYERIGATIDKSSVVMHPVIRLTGNWAGYERSKEVAIERVLQGLPDVFLKVAPYIDKVLGIEVTMTERIRDLSSAKFEDLLHPIFKEDEWILILVGGLLGYMVGTLQWYVLGT